MNQTNQTKKAFFIILPVITILAGASIFAAPPAPTPVCRIEGIIKSIEFKNAYDEACLKEPNGCPTDVELYHPARYILYVNVNSVSYVSGETNFITCENMYPVGNIKNIFLNKDKVKPGDTFSADQKIEGVARSFWGSSFDSYNLTGTTTQIYTNNLYYGLKHPLVERMQKDLSSDSLVYPEKLVTGYFGSLTFKAVKRFQAKYGIIQTGYVGPLTRARLNELYSTEFPAVTGCIMNVHVFYKVPNMKVKSAFDVERIFSEFTAKGGIINKPGDSYFYRFKSATIHGNLWGKNYWKVIVEKRVDDPSSTNFGKWLTEESYDVSEDGEVAALYPCI